MKKLLILLGIVFFSISYVTAQKETWNWAFGSNSGLTWVPDQLRSHPATGIGGTPDTVLDNLPGTFSPSIKTLEGCFSISDMDGNLLFYSDGVNIWKKDGTQINTQSLLCGNRSSAQSGIALPFPADPARYICVGLSWVIDNNMCAQVIKATNPDDVILDGEKIYFFGHQGLLGESMSAIKHANGIDWWLIAVGKDNTNTCFNAWSATEDGMENTTPVITATGIGVNPGTSNGYLKFTPDGKHFAYATWEVKKLIFGDFDAASGQFSNVREINGNGFYGVEFVDNGKYLYTTSCLSGRDATPAGPIRIYDFEALKGAADPSTILPRELSDVIAHGAIQLAPDGRLYASDYYYSFNNNTNALYVIDNPEDIDNLRAYRLDNFHSSSSYGTMGLPSFSASFFQTKIEGPDKVCMDEPLSFSLKVKQGLGDSELLHTVWDFGDGTVHEDDDFSNSEQTRNYTYKKTGNYTITVRSFLRSGIEVVGQRKTKNIKVNPCVMPVNPNIHLYK